MEDTEFFQLGIDKKALEKCGIWPGLKHEQDLYM